MTFKNTAERRRYWRIAMRLWRSQNPKRDREIKRKYYHRKTARGYRLRFVDGKRRWVKVVKK